MGFSRSFLTHLVSRFGVEIPLKRHFVVSSFSHTSVDQHQSSQSTTTLYCLKCYAMASTTVEMDLTRSLVHMSVYQSQMH